MRIETRELDSLNRKTYIPIGWTGEKNHVQVRINCAGFFAEYPGAAASIAVKPPKGDVYPVVVTIEDDQVVWDISEADLSVAGYGVFQITFTLDEEIIKTVISSYVVNESLEPAGEAPEALDTWMDAAFERLAAVNIAIASIDNMTVSASGLPAGSDPTASIDDVDGHKAIHFEIPKGDKGDKGDTYELTQEDREEIAEIAEENFSDTVKGYRDEAIEAADHAEQAASRAGYMDMEIVNGRLIYRHTDNVTDVDFALVDGHLIWRVA